jgi:hypothetical protein
MLSVALFDALMAPPVVRAVLAVKLHPLTSPADSANMFAEGFCQGLSGCTLYPPGVDRNDVIEKEHVSAVCAAEMLQPAWNRQNAIQPSLQGKNKDGCIQT